MPRPLNSVPRRRNGLRLGVNFCFLLTHRFSGTVRAIPPALWSFYGAWVIATNAGSGGIEGLREVAHSSWYRALCPVHRSLIAMSGSSGEVAVMLPAPVQNARTCPSPFWLPNYGAGAAWFTAMSEFVMSTAASFPTSASGSCQL